MYKTLTIKNGSTNIISASTNPKAAYDSNVLIEEDFDIVDIVIDTESKLTGAGSYIVSERVEEKEWSVTINVYNQKRTYYNNLVSQGLSFNNLKFQFQYFNQNSETAFETKTLEGKITSVNLSNGYKDWGEIEINIKSVNPIKS